MRETIELPTCERQALLSITDLVRRNVEEKKSVRRELRAVYARWPTDC